MISMHVLFKFSKYYLVIEHLNMKQFEAEFMCKKVKLDFRTKKKTLIYQ